MPKIGLKNIHLSKLLLDTEEVGTIYEAPIKFLGAVQADIKPASTNENFYSDDQLSSSVSQLGDISVDLEMGDLPSEMQIFLLGARADDSGVIHFSKDDVAPYVAMGYESALSNGGKRIEWLLKGKFALPESSSKTKGDKVDFSTQKISAIFVARRSDGEWKLNADTTDKELETYAVENWFKKVYKKFTMDGEFTMNGTITFNGKVAK